MPSRSAVRIRRHTDNVRLRTHPLPLLPFGTSLDDADSIPEEAKHAIRTYHPRNATQTAWEHTEDFVRSIAVVLNPSNYDQARLAMTMLGQFVCWVWTAYSCDLTIEKIFTGAHVRLYVDTQKKDIAYSSRFDITRFLGTVTTRLTGKPTHRMLPPVGKPAKPFTSGELAQLESWATKLSTPLRRRNAHALLAMCAGAGLTSQEFVRVETDDVSHRDGTYFVDVADAENGTVRTVPVLREWNHSVETALKGNTGDVIFQGHRGKDVECRGLQSFLTECTLPTDTRATASRLRATWLTTQLNRGTPLPLLLELSGLSSLASLDAHLQNLPTVSLAQHLEAVAGKQVSA